MSDKYLDRIAVAIERVAKAIEDYHQYHREAGEKAEAYMESISKAHARSNDILQTAHLARQRPEGKAS